MTKLLEKVTGWRLIALPEYLRKSKLLKSALMFYMWTRSLDTTIVSVISGWNVIRNPEIRR